MSFDQQKQAVTEAKCYSSSKRCHLLIHISYIQTAFLSCLLHRNAFRGVYTPLRVAVSTHFSSGRDPGCQSTEQLLLNSTAPMC